MKQSLSILFILGMISGHSQIRATKNTINTDSLIKRLNLARNKSVGQYYPDFSITADGIQYSKQTLGGKVVFINFWFSTCAPCIAEMEDLNNLFTKFGGDKKFEFLSFTFENPDEIDRIRKKYNIQYKVFSITEKECYRLNLNGGFPTNIVLDPNYKVKYISQIGQGDSFIDIQKLILNSL